MSKFHAAVKIRKMINNHAVKEFDAEELMDLFEVDPDSDNPWQVCNELTNVLIELELTDEERKRAKRMFELMAANMATFICDNVI